MHDSLRRLSNRQLLARLSHMAQNERSATAALVAHLCEMDRRGLHRDQGYGSLFDYCVRVLRLSESAAYLRIHAARLGRRYPEVLRYLAQGELHLSALKLLGPKLTCENHQELLQVAAGKCKRDLEALLAERFAAPEAETVIRKLPQSAPGRAAEPLSLLSPPVAEQAASKAAVPAPAPARASAAASRPAPPPLTPLSPQRFKVQFTASQALHDKLQTARRLTRHRHPGGDVAAVVEQALELLIEREMKRQFGQTSRPRARRKPPKPGSRHIPAEVRREPGTVTNPDADRAGIRLHKAFRRVSEYWGVFASEAKAL